MSCHGACIISHPTSPQSSENIIINTVGISHSYYYRMPFPPCINPARYWLPGTVPTTETFLTRTRRHALPAPPAERKSLRQGQEPVEKHHLQLPNSLLGLRKTPTGPRPSMVLYVHPGLGALVLACSPFTSCVRACIVGPHSTAQMSSSIRLKLSGPPNATWRQYPYRSNECWARLRS